jgi:hypothetical protein
MERCMTRCRTPIRLLLLSALTTVFACAGPIEIETGGIRLEVNPSGIEVRNSRTATIYVFAADRATAPLILWGACSDPDRCEGIEPGARRVLAPAEIAGYGTSDEVIVYWWHLVPAEDGGFEPDGIRSIIVRR